MKKFYIFILLLGLMVGFLCSCNDDCDCIPYVPEPEIPTAPVVTITNGEYTIELTDSIVFRANVTSELPATYRWTIGEQEMSTDSLYVFKADAAGVYTLQVTVTNETGSQIQSVQIIVKETPEEEVPLEEGKYKHGTFILNEGFVGTHGSLIYISPNGEITPNVYRYENGKYLWNLTQDLFIYKDKMYIIAQKGTDVSSDYGALTILNAETLKEEFSYSFPWDLGFNAPTHIAVLGENDIYIRDGFTTTGGKIRVFHPVDSTVSIISGTEGASKNTMAVVKGKLFASISNKPVVVVIEKGKTEISKTINFNGLVSGIIKSSDNKLWVSDESGKISKIDPDTYETIAYNQLTGEAAERLKINPDDSHAAAPHITAKGDTLYMSATTTTIYAHIFNADNTTGATVLAVDAKNYIPVSPDYWEGNWTHPFVYNTCAVHPITGEVYINTLKGIGGERHNNHISIFDITYSYSRRGKLQATPRLARDYANYLDYPANVYFTYNFE